MTKTMFITTFLIAAVVCCKAQVFTSPPPDYSQPKQNITCLIVYRIWEPQHLRDVGDPLYSWNTKVAYFLNKDELLEWMNGNDGLWLGEHHDTTTRLTEDQIIGVYDLATAKKLTLKFTEEHKSLPKRVEYEAIKWTVRKASIQP